MRRLALLLISLCLAMPALAADTARAARKEVFGDITVHYGAFTSSMLTPQVAAATGLVRSRHQGVLSLTVLRAGKPITAVVSGAVKDLTGRKQPLAFKRVTDHGTASYVAQFKIEHPETVVFELGVQAGGVSHSFSFNQDVFPGE
ncbi:DUF4426 domain-containing protein [Pseudomonas fulva]|uniref:DUF4426 domain-containing protein n=1 Tax=Pseudomonas fulva TaxID=47880 RepID=UPI003EEA4694